jgi:hypothetical protein
MLTAPGEFHVPVSWRTSRKIQAMFSTARILKSASWLMLVPLILAAAPAAAEAGWVGFRNETNSALVVQISNVTQGRVQHGKPHLLSPGNVSWERILQPGSKLVTIYDPAQPRRILFQTTLVYAGNDLFFAIQMEPVPAGAPGAVPPVPKLKLAPAKPAAPPGP